MAEGRDEYLNRKMKEVQDLIQEATMANALGTPAILDGFNPTAGGAIIEIKIVIMESKLNEFRQMKK